MRSQALRSGFQIVFFGCAAWAQVLTIPGSSSRFSNAFALDAIQSAQMDFDFLTIDSRNENLSPLQTPSGGVSKLDLKAPGKAQGEYHKGYQLLLRKNPKAAVEHLAGAITVYPQYVAARNALGTAYLNLNENEKAREQFSQAAVLDNHMPNSYLNLGCAQLALKQYRDAEEAFQKASSLAPLDRQIKLALAYGEFVNKDYSAVIETARNLHSRRHEGTALVHFFAAAALEAQNDLKGAQDEIKLLLIEDPKSPSLEQFRKILAQLQQEELQHAQLKFDPVQKVTSSIGIPTGTSPDLVNRMAQIAAQNLQSKEQIEEAEKEPEPVSSDSGLIAPGASHPAPEEASGESAETIIHASVDEVSILFAATERGKSVTDLASSDVQVRDNRQPPKAVLQFRNETQLPLRLGLVIDISNSVTDRFKFEQAAAIQFLQKVVTGADDLAFVVGVNNTVLVAQDFTADQKALAHAIEELAPTGGTALWDALNLGAEKLANRAETQPVARVMVVISDGEDNSSSLTLKEMIGGVLGREVAVYTVSTRDLFNETEAAILGDHALQTISQLTGGAAYRPGSVSALNGSLRQLQEVIRSRYLISYKPASFQRDGHYRPIEITAEKAGHKLRVYARQGYYAWAAAPRKRSASQ